jgi:hypothetical protein
MKRSALEGRKLIWINHTYRSSKRIACFVAIETCYSHTLFFVVFTLDLAPFRARRRGRPFPGVKTWLKPRAESSRPLRGEEPFQRNPHFRSKGSCREPVIRVFPYPFKKGLAQINWCFALQFWTRQAVKEEVLILAELTRNLAGPTTGGAL